MRPLPERRWQSLREWVKAESGLLLLCDSLLIEAATGLRMSSGALLVTPEGGWVSTNALYDEALIAVLGAYSGELELVSQGEMRERIKQRSQITSIFVHGARTPYVVTQPWWEQEIVTCDTQIMEILGLLEPHEEVTLRSLLPLVERTIESVLVQQMQEGVTERALAWSLERALRDATGADEMSFSPIVAFGGHTALPHHHPSDRVLEWNMPVLCDIGVRDVGGICTDMTWSLWHGDSPDPDWQADYAKVQAALEACAMMLEPGVRCDALCEKARQELGEEMIHSLGHGVGVEVHTGVRIHPRSDQSLQPGTAVTLEPALYREGRYGIRLEQTYLV